MTPPLIEQYLAEAITKGGLEYHLSKTENGFRFETENQDDDHEYPTILFEEHRGYVFLKLKTGVASKDWEGTSLPKALLVRNTMLPNLYWALDDEWIIRSNQIKMNSLDILRVIQLALTEYYRFRKNLTLTDDFLYRIMIS